MVTKTVRVINTESGESEYALAIPSTTMSPGSDSALSMAAHALSSSLPLRIHSSVKPERIDRQERAFQRQERSKGGSERRKLCGAGVGVGVVGVWSLEVEGRRLLVEVLDVYQLQCILVHVTCASNQIKNHHDPQPLPNILDMRAPLPHIE